MNNIIETKGLAAAAKMWNDQSLKLKTLQGRIAYVHEQEKRHTGKDYSSYPSAKEYADAMINAIIKKYNDLQPYEKTLDKAAYRTWLLIQDQDGLLYARTMFEDMYNNH